MKIVRAQRANPACSFRLVAIALVTMSLVACTSTTTIGAIPKTFAHRVLSLDAQYDHVPSDATKHLDELIAAIRSKYGSVAPKGRDGMLNLLMAIDHAITEANFVFPPCRWTETLGDAFVPHRLSDEDLKLVLDRGANARRVPHILAHRKEKFRFLDCDTGSFVYMGVAETYGIHLDLVNLPTHNFVRWTVAGLRPLNWDTNRATEFDDATYARAYGVTPEQIRKRVYLVSMTADETWAYLYLIEAGRLRRLGRPAAATRAYEESLRLARTPGAANDLSWHIATTAGLKGRAKEAVSLAREAISLRDTIDYHDTLACALALAGDMQSAIATEAAVVAQEPSKTYQERLKILRNGKTCVGATDDNSSCQ
jgi:hypothetical protein